MRDAVAADAMELAPRMADADTLEVWRCSHQTPLQALQEAVATSHHARACVGPSGLVCGMWGSVHHDETPEWGHGWFLGADELRLRPRVFLGITVREMNLAMDKEARGLYGVVDEQYGAALRWLGWLGFTSRARVTSDASGEPFVLMVLEASTWAAAAKTSTGTAARC